jgi:Na+/H+ antiporter NhaC
VVKEITKRVNAMLDSLVANYKIIIPVVIFLTALVKVLHFLNYKRRNWGFRKLIYFSDVEIFGSDDPYTKSAKRVQNALSLVIVLLIAILLIMLYLLRDISI